MGFSTIDQRFTSGQVTKIRKLAGKCIEISDITASADAQSTVTLTDGVKTRVLDVAPGTNHRCPGMIFSGEADITITCAGGNVSFYAHVWKK